MNLETFNECIDELVLSRCLIHPVWVGKKAACGGDSGKATLRGGTNRGGDITWENIDGGFFDVSRLPEFPSTWFHFRENDERRRRGQCSGHATPHSSGLLGTDSPIHHNTDHIACMGLFRCFLSWKPTSLAPAISSNTVPLSFISSASPLPYHAGFHFPQIKTHVEWWVKHGFLRSSRKWFSCLLTD